MTNKEITELLRKAYNDHDSAIKFPKYIDVIDNGNDSIIIKLRENGVISNMQEDNSAFESWVLILKRWIKKWQQCGFELQWDKPEIKEKREASHYERFLYRVYKFHDLFKWFKIDEGLLKDSQINYVSGKEENKYMVNKPSKSRENDTAAIKGERCVERQFARGESASLKEIANVKKLERQLPVGLFLNKVGRCKAVFPAGAGQIDLWGIGNDGKTLNIFELKIENNRKVGIITELFFYVMFIHDVIENRFELSEPREEFKPIKNIRAYMLSPSLHPLVDQEVIKIINKVMAEKMISFHYMEYNDKLECILPWEK